MSNYTNYTEEFKTRILTDYADTEKTCWASDSGKTVAECHCPQCIEGKLLYPVLKELDMLAKQYAQSERFLAVSREVVSKASNIIEQAIENDDISSDELQEPFWIELCEALGVDINEEVEVTFTAVYSGYVTVPKGTDVSTLEIELDWHPGVTLNGEGVGSASQDSVEAE